METAQVASGAEELVPFSESRSFRFALLFGLGMTEVMPVALLTSAMPVVLRRSGANMQQLGLLSIVMLPWALKAFWAPLVDKWGARNKLGRYRGWLFITHPLLLLTLLLGSFVDVPSLVLHNRAVGFPALLFLSMISATADTAAHGLAVNLLTPDERGLGTGVATVGMMAGTLIGGGLMVMLVDKLGWQQPLLLMSAMILVPLFGLLFYHERPVPSAHAINFHEVIAFFRRPRMLRWLVALVTPSLLTSLPSVPFQALFVDHGMSLTEIGLVLGVMSSIAGAIGGALGGYSVKELGRQRAFFALNILCAICLAGGSLIVSLGSPSRSLLYGAVGATFFGIAAGRTIMRAMIMDRCRPHLASTDFTLQASAAALVDAVGAATGGLLAGYLGAKVLFLSAPVLMVGMILVCARVLDRRDFQATQE